MRIGFNSASASTVTTNTQKVMKVPLRKAETKEAFKFASDGDRNFSSTSSKMRKLFPWLVIPTAYLLSHFWVPGTVQPVLALSPPEMEPPVSATPTPIATATPTVQEVREPSGATNFSDYAPFVPKPLADIMVRQTHARETAEGIANRLENAIERIAHNESSLTDIEHLLRAMMRLQRSGTYLTEQSELDLSSIGAHLTRMRADRLGYESEVQRIDAALLVLDEVFEAYAVPMRGPRIAFDHPDQDTSRAIGLQLFILERIDPTEEGAASKAKGAIADLCQAMIQQREHLSPEQVQGIANTAYRYVKPNIEAWTSHMFSGYSAEGFGYSINAIQRLVGDERTALDNLALYHDADVIFDVVPREEHQERHQEVTRDLKLFVVSVETGTVSEALLEKLLGHVRFYEREIQGITADYPLDQQLHRNYEISIRQICREIAVALNSGNRSIPPLQEATLGEYSISPRSVKILDGLNQLSPYAGLNGILEELISPGRVGSRIFTTSERDIEIEKQVVTALNNIRRIADQENRVSNEDLRGLYDAMVYYRETATAIGTMSPISSAHYGSLSRDVAVSLSDVLQGRIVDLTVGFDVITTMDLLRATEPTELQKLTEDTAEAYFRTAEREYEEAKAELLTRADRLFEGSFPVTPELRKDLIGITEGGESIENTPRPEAEVEERQLRLESWVNDALRRSPGSKAPTSIVDHLSPTVEEAAQRFQKLRKYQAL